MAKKKFLEHLNVKPVDDSQPEAELEGLSLDETDVAVAELEPEVPPISVERIDPDSQLPIPDVPDNVTLMLAPKETRGGFIKGQWIATYDAQIKVDNYGYAHCKSQNSVTYCGLLGFKRIYK